MHDVKMPLQQLTETLFKIQFLDTDANPVTIQGFISVSILSEETLYDQNHAFDNIQPIPPGNSLHCLSWGIKSLGFHT
jgi:hypothetical protein